MGQDGGQEQMSRVLGQGTKKSRERNLGCSIRSQEPGVQECRSAGRPSMM